MIPDLCVRLRRAAVIAAILATFPGTANAEPVTACGQTVAFGELTANLDCSGYDAGPALFVTRELTLNGFTITGNADLPALPGNFKAEDHAIITCPGSCSIVGPGTLTSGPNGVVGLGNVTLTDVAVLDTSIAQSPSSSVLGAVRSLYKKVTLRNCTVSNHQEGVMGMRVRVFDSSVSNTFGALVWGENAADVRGSTLTDGVWGVTAGRNLRLEDSTITGNVQYGVAHGAGSHNSGTARITGSTISGNGNEGVLGGGRVLVRNSTITNNGHSGINHSAVVVSGSDVSGNCVASLDPANCADLVACAAPIAAAVTCETSLCADYGCVIPCEVGTDWDTCSMD